MTFVPELTPITSARSLFHTRQYTGVVFRTYTDKLPCDVSNCAHLPFRYIAFVRCVDDTWLGYMEWPLDMYAVSNPAVIMGWTVKDDGMTYQNHMCSNMNKPREAVVLDLRRVQKRGSPIIEHTNVQQFTYKYNW